MSNPSSVIESVIEIDSGQPARYHIPCLKHGFYHAQVVELVDTHG
ncbi:MAG: hypothetical protein ABIH23_32480 [bacterium]